MSTPLDQLQRAAALMRSHAREMRAEMARYPRTWAPGYRAVLYDALDGHAGMLAARWDPDTVDAVAGLLEQEARQYQLYGSAAQQFLAGDDGGDADPAIAVARAYLGESP